MDQISSKTVEVASLPKFRLPMNLQLFAEEGEAPNLEDSPEFKQDAKEFNEFESKVAKFTEDRQAKETVKEAAKQTKEDKPAAEPTEKQEVVTPDKPKQDAETNKAFQEMRQKLDAAEKEKSDIEAKAKKADDLISKQWGHLGVHTVEQYEQRLQQEKEQEETDRYTEAGLKPDEIEKLRNYDILKGELENKTVAEIQQDTAKQWGTLYSAYPEVEEAIIKFNKGETQTIYNAEMQAEIARGASPLAAYRHAHFETILANATKGIKEVTKQEALNQLNSKDHIKANSTGGGEVDHVQISEAQMAQYRAYNKGKTDAQIRAFHKKQLAGG